MPRSWNARISESGITIEPAFSILSDERSLFAQAGCAITAWIVAGTSSEIVGLRAATSASQWPGSKRLCRVTVAPACSAGSVWLLRPPTWNIGRQVSTWSAWPRSCAWIELKPFQISADCVSTAPLGLPVVPEV